MKDLKQLGKDIKEKRFECGLSQDELASKAEIERSQLSKIENGTIQGITYYTIAKIYEALDYTLVPAKENKLTLHPFVKWAGGKTQLLSILEERVPKEFNTYYEPFVGGGALLFKLQPNKFVINDVNEELMCAYKCLASDYSKLKKELLKHTSKHNEEYYYKIREMDRKDDFLTLPFYKRAARMIYLNKACFNGLYRVNSKGYFNVPSGKYEKVNCFDADNFDNLHVFLQKGNILNTDYKDVVKTAKKGDFVYFDPPYDTLEEKDSFTSYSKDNFGKKEQKELAEVFKKLNKKGVYVMLSNHNTPLINELYKDFNIEVIKAKRMINSNGKGRGEVEEVIITNY